MIRSIVFFIICLVSFVSAADRPNIIFIFADDLGYGDLGCYGHPYAQTPALDQLAREGTRFTQAYVTGVTCCPSRTGALTGKFPATFSKYMADHGFGGRVTITELLKKNGYRTGHFGKWHIGPETKNGTYGIDVINGNQRKGRGKNQRGRDAYLIDGAIEFLEKNANKGQPLYLNVWGHISHFPVRPPKAFAERFKEVVVDETKFNGTMRGKFQHCRDLKGNVNEGMRNYLGDVWSMDAGIGRLLKKVDELDLRKNTIVVFSSDHGPAPVKLAGNRNADASRIDAARNMLGSPGRFRGGKHTQFEGGVRVPFIIRWPGRVPANRVNTTSAISFIDWLPTLCALTGTKPAAPNLDGENVSDIWLGAKRTRTKPLYWRVNSTTGRTAVRVGNWKFYDYNNRQTGPMLFDLAKDPGEARNVLKENPKVVRQLRLTIADWAATLPKEYTKPNKQKRKPKNRPQPKPPTRKEATAKPNFIFILADDMPWYGTAVQMEKGFASSAGSTRRTPNIDQLAKRGMVFSRAFAPAGMCAPSRCSIQTGMSAARTRFSGNGNFDAPTREVIYGGRRSKGKLVLEPQPIGSLDPKQDTIAEYLKPLGYASAHIGKWHIYGGGPGKHGYDVHDGATTNTEGKAKDPKDPKNIFSITRKAIAFMEIQAKAGRPFYLQVSHYAEHNAVQCLPETAAACLKLPGIRDIRPNGLRKRVAERTAMVLDMDRSIGTLLARLDALGLRDNTYVVFMSDNGHHRDTGAKKFLRGNKWWLWEGGIRVPMIVSGPNIKAGAQCDVNVVGYDFLPTFVDLAGGDLSKLHDIDGASIKSLLRGRELPAFAGRYLHFHYPHHRNTAPHSVVLQGDLKYFRFYERPDSHYLYNLKYNIGESENIAAQNKAAVTRLSAEMNRYHAAIKASLPKPNPDADPNYKPYDPDKGWE